MKTSKKLADVAKLEGAFVAYTLDFKRSAAMHNLPVNARRLLDFLEIRHLENGGAENGELLAEYDDLVKFGISRKLIAPAIREAERRRLITVRRHGFDPATRRTPRSRFRLTYLPTKVADGQWASPGDEWRAYGQTKDTVHEPTQFPKGNRYEVPKGEFCHPVVKGEPVRSSQKGTQSTRQKGNSFLRSSLTRKATQEEDRTQ